MIQSNQILLNGLTYHSANFHNLFFENEPTDSWRNSIFYFLQNWFDDSDFILSYTSGSTGQPKEIKLAKQTMINSACMTNEFFGLDSSTTALLCLPASYIAGKMMLVRAIVGGFQLLAVEPKANPFENCRVKIDFCAITPYQLIHSVDSLKGSSVGTMIVGGGAVNSYLETLVKDIPTAFFETYGMTETCSHIALRRLNGGDKSDSFTVLNGIGIRQDDRDCLVVEAPHLVAGEIVTNDRVELVTDRTFRWLGRYDSVINSGGVKIHPEQVEKKLEGIIPSSFFIASVPDVEFENKVILVIESECPDAISEDSMLRKIKAVLNNYEMPKHVYYLSHFVYSSATKILREATLRKILSS